MAESRQSKRLAKRKPTGGGRKEKVNENDSMVGPGRPMTASEQTIKSGGKDSDGGAYNPHTSNRSPERTQPVMPGQTGYINKRRPVLRPSANLAPKDSASDANNNYRQTGEKPTPEHRPYAQKFLDRLHSVREDMKGTTNTQQPPKRRDTAGPAERGWSGRAVRDARGDGGSGPGGGSSGPVDPGRGPGGEGNQGGSGSGGFFPGNQIRKP